MKITESQIQKLYKFTRQHYVYHYDVQTELVDHLANDIEAFWKENPNLSFEKARDKSFKKFGVFGFMDVIEAKQKQMNKRYWKIIWRFMQEWFTIPKLIMTIAIFLVFFMIIQIPKSAYFLVGGLLVAITCEMIAIRKFKKAQEKKKEKDEKIFLLEAMIGATKNGYTGFTFINLFNLINLTHIEFAHLNLYWITLISFIATLLVILFYVSNYVLPQKAEELLQETYSEYKIVKNL